jgi:hypothetical protein
MFNERTIAVQALDSIETVVLLMCNIYDLVLSYEDDTFNQAPQR